MKADNKDEQPRWLSWAVISIWVLFGAIITIVVLSRNPDWIKPLELIIQVLTVLFAAAAVIAAVGSVKVAQETLAQARDDRKEELLHKRPYFSYIKGQFIRYEYEDGEGSNDCLEVFFKQIGTNPAANLTVTTTIVRSPQEGEDAWHMERTFEAVNDVASGFEFRLIELELSLDKRSRHHYVIFDLAYNDAVYGARFEQRIYEQWNGFEYDYINGVVEEVSSEAPLHYMTKRDLTEMLQIFETIQVTNEKNQRG